MKTEFHYYVTYLVAVQAGFSPGQAQTLAYASQHVDDNGTCYEIREAGEPVFFSQVSQTLDRRRPDPRLGDVYAVFHFVPGDPRAASRRKDGAAWDPWVTTPDSGNARRLLDAALSSGDLYRIGVGCHAYVDSWAHQNFIGRVHPQNAFGGAGLSELGHADALQVPDEVGGRWHDPRLVDDAVDNNDRFVAAARALCRRLQAAHGHSGREAVIAAELGAIFALPDASARHDAYGDLARDLGRSSLPPYDQDRWRAAAIMPGYRDERGESWVWRNPAAREKTDWFRFQAAIAAHRHAAMRVLSEVEPVRVGP